MSRYNGWANIATWNANLWLSNEERIYRRIRAILQDPELGIEGAAIALRVHLGNVWKSGRTPDGHPLHEVDWVEIVRSWRRDTSADAA